jgi:hypothetical protein
MLAGASRQSNGVHAAGKGSRFPSASLTTWKDCLNVGYNYKPHRRWKKSLHALEEIGVPERSTRDVTKDDGEAIRDREGRVALQAESSPRTRTFAFDTLSLRRLWPSVCAEEAVAAKLRIAEVSCGYVAAPSSRRAS